MRRIFRSFVSMPNLKTGDYMQKFYKHAGVKETEKGFQVLLDGRGIKTPERNNVILPTEILALGVATEWQVQDKFIRTSSMPLFQLSATAIDLSHTGIRPQLTERIHQFLQNDSICYREDEQEKSDRQTKLFTPVINHVKEKYGIELSTCSGFSTPQISKESFDNLQKHIETLDSFEIVALEAATTIAKSTSVGLSLLDGFLSIENSLKCSRLEEDLQIEAYGKVEGHHDLDELSSLVVLAAAKTLISFKNFNS
ncbi:ATPAF2 [Blepharisma stoltei]|uniref:ATP synthase mitochondrial F1 complex assembly factor 2 n=1 Tax=Blepharisma stoltei TaxID=1481888 RepID=A0AAU9JNS2_9CILI|nr:unnamed protein product [Blepharisma stoltei]